MEGIMAGKNIVKEASTPTLGVIADAGTTDGQTATPTVVPAVVPEQSTPTDDETSPGTVAPEQPTSVVEPEPGEPHPTAPWAPDTHIVPAIEPEQATPSEGEPSPGPDVVPQENPSDTPPTTPYPGDEETTAVTVPAEMVETMKAEYEAEIADLKARLDDSADDVAAPKSATKKAQSAADAHAAEIYRGDYIPVGHPAYAAAANGAGGAKADYIPAVTTFNCPYCDFKGKSQQAFFAHSKIHAK